MQSKEVVTSLLKTSLFWNTTMEIMLRMVGQIVAPISVFLLVFVACDLVQEISSSSQM